MRNTSVFAAWLPGLLAGIVVGSGLYLSSRYNFLLFHAMTELASIAVAYGLFMLAWNSREFNENRYIVFLGIAYLFVGSLDFVHTLAYKGMNIFPGYDANLPTQLWIAARYLESLSLLFAIAFLQYRLKSEQVFGVYSVIFAILLFTTFSGIFPDCYYEGLGLTSFKIVSEYVISAILLTALVMLARKRAAFEPPILKLMAASLVFTICSELAFTFYISVYGFSNLIGHYFKLISFYLIYKAVIETGLREPYTVMFRNMRDSQGKLRESEARFRRLAENAPEIIYRYDLLPESHFDYVSPAATTITGYTPDEHYSDPRLGLKIIAPEDQECFQRYITRLLECQITQHEMIELRWLHKDGRLIWTEQHITPVHDAAGNLIAIEGIARDVTDRKQTEQVLQEKEQRLRLSLIGSGVSFWEWFPEDGMVGFDQHWANILGYEPGEKDFNFMWWEGAIHPDSRPVFEKALNDYLAGRKPRYELEYQIKTKTGEWKWIWAAGECVEYTHDGKPKRFLGTHRDITDHKQVEAILRESEQKYRLLAESIPGVVHQFILHPDGSTSIPYINERIAEYAGIAAEAVMADPPLLFTPVHPDDQAMIQETIAMSARNLQDFCVEHRLIDRHGEIRWFRVHSIPEQLSNGDILWNGVSIEITDQKRIEQTLRENEKRYRNAQKIGRVGNWEYNIQTTEFWGSDEAKRIYGFDPTSPSFTTEEVERCIPDRLRVHQALVDLLERDQEYNIEFDIITRNTQERKTIVSLAELERDVHGNPLKVTGVIQDITERKQVQAALVRVRYSIDRLTDSVFWIDEDGKFIDVNDMACRNLGYEREELLTLCVADIDPNFPHETWPAHWSQMALCGVMSTESVHQTKNGRTYPVEVVIHNQRFGDVRYNCVLARDITERKQAEEELKQYQQIVSSTPDAISLVDREYHYRIVNASYERFSNMKCERLLGLSVAEYLGEEVFQQYIKPHFDRCLQGETIQFQEWFDYPTLGRRFVQVTYFPYRDAENNISGVVANTRDITEIKEVEEQLKAALREKEVLLREIHHRVKNNLMVVQSLIEMQSYQTRQPEALDLFRDLRNRVMAMSMVHQDLYQSENLAQIDFSRYLERLLINIRQGFAKTRAAIKVVAEEIFLDVEKAIPCGLIAAELATNAFKYAFPAPPSSRLRSMTGTPHVERSRDAISDENLTALPKGRELLPLLRRGPGGGSETGGESSEIRVEMRKMDQTYTLIVSDNGAGLPPDLDWRNTNTLGLNLVHSWAVHQLKGTIEVDNHRGATFRIVFTA